MSAPMKALLLIGGLSFYGIASSQQSNTIELEGVELKVFDLAAAFEASIKARDQWFEERSLFHYNYLQETTYVQHNSSLVREVSLDYASLISGQGVSAIRWQAYPIGKDECLSVNLPYPDLAFLNQTLHLEFYQHLFNEFLERLVITQEEDEHLTRIEVHSKFLGAIDRLFAVILVDTQSLHIESLQLSLLIDPLYESHKQKWKTQSLTIELDFENGISTAYRAHTSLLSKDRRFKEPLRFTQRLKRLPLALWPKSSQSTIDLNNALKPFCSE